MADQQIDHISIQIEEELGNISPISSKCNIFKVPNQLRQIKDKAYDPEVVAIGPYHYGKDLHVIKQLKLCYLQKLLQRRREERDVGKYVIAMWKMKEEAHNCYEQLVSLNNVEFVKMMLFDACFIVELVRKNQNVRWRDENDPIFQMSWLLSSVQRDLLLVENQIPFFVLRKLFDMTEMPNQQDNLTEMVRQFICLDSALKYEPHRQYCSLPSVAENDQPPPEYCSLPSGPENEPPPEYSSSQEIKHILSLLHENICPPYEGDVATKTPKLIRSATELHEAGIEFKNGDAKNLFDVKFKNGIIEIPVLKVEDGTESIFRNLIAYEQHHDNETKHVTNYITFMDCLISSPRDVELLRLQGIIDNWLGDDNVVASMFNKLGNSVIIDISEDAFYYAKLFNDLNDHCSKRRNKWMANLRHNYFNSPWALISFLAASLLLLMTLVQTIFSVLA